MSALNWVRSKAKTTVETTVLGGVNVEITSIYFRGVIPFHMKASILKEAKTLENTETVNEKVLFSNKTSLEYWHTTYKEI